MRKVILQLYFCLTILNILPLSALEEEKLFLKTLFNPPKAYHLVACLFFQNEAPYLKEWIEYHRLIGVEHFYLYNNESTDNYLEILQPYIKKGIVQLKNVYGVTHSQGDHAHLQYSSYRDAIAKACRHHVKWLALIDADEFIVPVQKNSLLEVLKDYEDYGGVYVNWLLFGTSGYKTIPKDLLMIEALTFGNINLENLGKSIVRPDRVSVCSDPHRLFYYAPYFHVNTNYETFDAICPKVSDKLVINHYWSRDQDHLINVKFPRRKKWIANLALDSILQMGESLNVVEHSEIQKFVPKLRKRMKLN